MVNFHPSREFWESSLEMPVSSLLKDFQNPILRESWLNSLSGRQLTVIFLHLFKDQQNAQLFKEHELWKHDDIPTQQKRKMLTDVSESLLNYYLVSRFSNSKSELAITEVAKPVLNSELYLLQNNKYDRKSLLFTLFITDPNLLKQIFHFNKVQKKSFSPCILKNPPRQRSTSFKDFLSDSVLQEILTHHDLSRDDGFTSQFQGFFHHQDRIYLFIRRASDSDLILNSNQVVHGYKPDRIILDFSSNANQVNLCTKNIKHGLKIANSIVSQYFEYECSFVDVHNHNAVAQVRTFISSCVQKSIPNVSMYELRFLSSKPRTYLTLTTDNIEGVLQKIEPVVGSVLRDISLIQHVKVMFESKKVTLSFQANIHDPNYIAINYSEHVLNKKEREDFKSLFKNIYGLTILSKAKSSYLQANNY
ncbi:putative phage related protein [Trichonephila clavata]|uniref:Putative phage related protein n=1 Tax=Trichonephila clavata TaxID=2740835 RepID=A0A8X6LWS9_TRICU|nr:putative phage related protein [Trichonephila clavata]